MEEKWNELGENKMKKKKTIKALKLMWWLSLDGILLELIILFGIWFYLINIFN